MLKLHHLDRSPFGWKVRIVLAEKNVPHTLVIPDNKTEDPAFVKLNPYRLTPVLELDGGTSIYESTVINEYLEEAYPEPAMLPKDPVERARVRMLEDTTDQYLYSRCGISAPRGSIRGAVPDPQTGRSDRSQASRNHAREDPRAPGVSSELAGRTFFGGAIILARRRQVGPRSPGRSAVGVLPRPYPQITAWTARIASRPSCAATGFPFASVTDDTRWVRVGALRPG
jgi:glutathione S-transferase